MTVTVGPVAPRGVCLSPMQARRSPVASTVDCESVVSILEQIARRGHSRHRVFRDWLDLMLFALQRRDDPYLDIVDRYSEQRDMDHPRGERTVDLFSNAFGQLQKRMADTNQDILGAVYEQFGMASDHFGQYFTPTPVCRLVADLSGPVAADSEDRRPMVSDPACGSGRMLLTAASENPDAVFVGQDKDSMCAKMAALNFCCFNLDGYVVQGDSLTIEFQRAWQTTSSSLGGSIRELDDDETEQLRNSLTRCFDTDSSPEQSGDMDASPGQTAAPDERQSAAPDGGKTEQGHSPSDGSLSVETVQESLFSFD